MTPETSLSGAQAWRGLPEIIPADAASKIPAGADTAGWGVHRVMGLETEFGIHAPAQPGAGHSVLSIELVNAYGQRIRAAGGSVAGTEWDYGEESPLTDARGWQLPRSAAHPTQLTDRALTDDDGQPVHLLLNVLLPNGARFYVDHAHPEYSSPETTNPWDAMIWDQAGDRVAQAAADQIALAEGTPEVLVYKNNTDNKSVSYGAHENYLIPRSLDFEFLAQQLIPFFVSRQVICGAGRVGLGQTGSVPGFQISQRADFFEEQIGLETTIRRPIINTRDEPHAAAERYRRLHVIIGDANLSQTATWLRCGMTALVLSMIELGTCPKLELADPVAALQTISHDPSLRSTVTVYGRGAHTGVDLLEIYLEAAEEHVEHFGMTDSQTLQVLRSWREIIDQLRQDPMQLADRLDWVAKYQLLSGLRNRHGLEWDHPKLGMLDLQYADLRPEKSLYQALVRRGSMTTLIEETTIDRAVSLPPRDTRAWLRGRVIDLFEPHLAGVSWDTLVLRPNREGRVHRYALREPLRGRADDVGALLGEDVHLDAPETHDAALTQLTHLLERLTASAPTPGFIEP
ncbi:MAG: depupylase/deamidase Dop [Micrococcaceae bacterium]